VELGKPYVICLSSRETVRSNDVTEGTGYERKQMPSLEREQENRSLYNWTDTVVLMDKSMTDWKEGPLLIGLQHENKFVANF
jgi:hypothetical protein